MLIIFMNFSMKKVTLLKCLPKKPFSLPDFLMEFL